MALLELSLLVALLFQSQFTLAANGKTLTNWDCCKPACAWGNFLDAAEAQGAVGVCDRNGNRLSSQQSFTERSACDTDNPGGNAFMCYDYSPKIVDDNLSYAFAITEDWVNCCKCFEMKWEAGPAEGKRVQVQIINIAEAGQGSFVLLVPGGGTGPTTQGCRAQFGSTWGREYGGVSSREECQNLPSTLQEGCYWRFNWAGGDLNEWPVSYTPISCPSYLVEKSGCSS